jgi:hypothetical protein
MTKLKAELTKLTFEGKEINRAWVATLAQYMINYDIGVSKVKSFDNIRKDSDFFVEE